MEIGSPGAILPAIEQAWRHRQADSWTGDAAATWEWISEAAEGVRNVALVGAAERPLACLRVIGRGRFAVAVPLGMHLDRFAPCPGTHADEFAAAIVRRRVPLRLQFAPAAIADAAATAIPGTIRRRTSEYAVIPAQPWDEYYAARRESLRKTLRHAHNQLPGELAVLAPGETAQALGELAAVEAAGHRPATVLTSEGGAFVRAVIARLDAAGAVETDVVRVDGHIAAYLISFASRRRLVLYTIGFRADLTRYSLGSLLVAAAIERSLRQAREVDLGKGHSHFKSRFADEERPLWDVLVVSPPVARAAELARHLRRTGLRFVRGTRG